MLMLKEMEYVYAVYQERSFSKAARKLYLSQPALSAAVRKAEAEIHTPIFDRSTNPIGLTPAGEYYIDAVKRILDIRQEMETYFESLAGECQGTVQVGAASYFCAHVLPNVMEEFQRQYPSWRVSLLEANARDLRQCLQSGVIDLSLDVEPADPHLFASTVWYEETILLAVPASFAINCGLEAFQLTAAQVRQGLHLQDTFPAVDLSRFFPGILSPFETGKRSSSAGRTPMPKRRFCPQSGHGAGPAAHLLLCGPGWEGLHLPARRHGPLHGG